MCGLVIFSQVEIILKPILIWDCPGCVIWLKKVEIGIL